MNASADELANGKKAKQKVKNNLHACESRVTRLSNMQRRENAIFLLFLRIFVLFENRRTERVKKLRVFVLIVDLRPSFVCTNKDRKSIWIYYRCWKNERKQQNYAFSADGKSKTGEKKEEWRIETGKERRASSLGASNKNSNRTFRSSSGFSLNVSPHARASFYSLRIVIHPHKYAHIYVLVMRLGYWRIGVAI